MAFHRGFTVQTKVHQGDIAGGRLWNKPINNLSLLVYRQLHLVGHSIIWPWKKLSWLSIKYFSSSSNHSLGAEKKSGDFSHRMLFMLQKFDFSVFFSHHKLNWAPETCRSSRTCVGPECGQLVVEQSIGSGILAAASRALMGTSEGRLGFTNRRC